MEYHFNKACPMSSCDDNIFSWGCKSNIEHGHCKKFKTVEELESLVPKQTEESK